MKAQSDANVNLDYKFWWRYGYWVGAFVGGFIVSVFSLRVEGYRIFYGTLSILFFISIIITLIYHQKRQTNLKATRRNK